MFQLAPVDEEDARTEFAEKLGIPRGDINQIRVMDWITGQVLITFHGGRKPMTEYLTPDVPAT